MSECLVAKSTTKIQNHSMYHDHYTVDQLWFILRQDNQWLFFCKIKQNKAK